MERQLVIFEEVEEKVIPFKVTADIRYWLNPGSNNSEERIFNFNGEVNLPLRFDMRRGHSFANIDDLEYAIIRTVEKIPNDVRIAVYDTFTYIPLTGKVRYVVWEAGGGMTNTGSATIIASTTGEALKPLFVRRSGNLACEDHAAFAVWEGQKAVKVDTSHHRRDFAIRIYELVATKESLKEKLLWKIAHVYDIEDVKEQIPIKYEKYLDAINAAMEKATIYHCRSAIYIKQ